MAISPEVHVMCFHSIQCYCLARVTRLCIVHPGLGLLRLVIVIRLIFVRCHVYFGDHFKMS